MNNEELSLNGLRKSTKLRLIVMSISMSLPIIILITMTVGNWSQDGQISDKSLFKAQPWLPYVLCVLFLCWLVYKVVRYACILKNDKFAEKVRIEKFDERNRYIKLMAGSLTHKIFIYALGVVCLFSAFIDYQYFVASGAVLIGFLLIHTIVYLVYRKKY